MGVTGIAITSKPLPFLGTPTDRVEALVWTVAGILATTAYALIANLAFDTTTTAIEFISLATGLACVWLSRTENIWSMPIGLCSVSLLGWFLLDVDLVAQGWLQYLFYVPISFVGWWMWARGGDHRTELPVTSLGRMGWIITVASGISTWAICLLVFNSIYEDARHLAWDSSIVGASIAAQVLMTYKKRECWFLWTVPVNLSSVGLYLATGNWAFLFLYLVFTANSVWAWSDWNRSLRTP